MEKASEVVQKNRRNMGFKKAKEKMEYEKERTVARI